jgi:GT2 family glycosyltransferase/glycosyltransferase involved in cell wall biosynthesis
LGAARGTSVTATPVTIIVPVYRNVDDTRSCLESVLQYADDLETAFDVLVIDDASPEPEVVAYVDSLRDTSTPVSITVLRNPENLGFVKTVNIGLRRASGDVVILNADTVVTPGWLDRLAAAAHEPDVATITPLTNHGSICTLPTSVIEAFELDSSAPRIEECAAFVARHSLEKRPEVITGVGFCMYTTRAALDAVGELDEDTFGTGYGEEVDFCLRATQMGYRHLVDDSTFIYHRGGGSFGTDGQHEGWRRSSAILDERYPFFRPTNQRERARDPLDVPFAALELGLQERCDDRPHVLHIIHSPPGATGGTEAFLFALMAALHDEFDFSILHPVPSGFVLHTFWNVGGGAPVEQEFLLPAGDFQVTRIDDAGAGAALEMALDLFEFDAVHVHNLIGHSLAPLSVLRDFDGPVIASVHDLFLGCPNFSLLYKKTEACGIPDDLAVCASCLDDTAASPMPGSPANSRLSVAYLDDFRATVAARLDVVDTWVFASQSAADYFLRVYDLDENRIDIIEHGSVIRLGRRGREPDAGLILNEPLRVAFVGMGWGKKGLDAVNSLVTKFAGSDVEIHHFGELKEPAAPELHAHGPYDNEYLPDLLHRAGIQIVLLPGPYAETFGIVMSEALAAGVPVIGASYGALGERIRTFGAGWTIDPMDHESIATLIERLDQCRAEILRVTRRVLETPLHTVAETVPRYAALYTGAEHAVSASA